jgi:type IX secretion system PorP/SprF family membrane protein
MRKNIISALLLSGVFGLCHAQMQVGQGINTWVHKSPQALNMSLISLHSVPTLTFEAGTRLDAFKNHPTQGSLLASGYISNGVGAGLKINREQAGLSSAIDVQLAFVYHVMLSQKGDKLSFFLAGHFLQDKLNVDNVVVLDPYDPALVGVSEYQPNGNASAGFSFLRENKYYFGVSSYQLIETKNAFMNPTWSNLKKRTYYVVGGYNFGLSENFEIEVSGAGAYVNEKAYAWEAGADLKFKRTLWLGAGYRSAGALKFNAGITAQSWSFGYMCTYGSWIDAKTYTYKAVNNSIFIRKIFNEGRPNK